MDQAHTVTAATYILWLVLAALVFVILSGLFGSSTLTEGLTMPRRSDIGPLTEGWTEEPGYERDLRYAETFTDIQGLGVATDFCRAVQQTGDPGSLQMACAIGRRDGMDTLEYRSRTQREGFRFSRDDYWRAGAHGRMDYCRILRDENTGHFNAMCAIAGPDGFKKREERDVDPPPHIRTLLRAYEGARAWFRWIDDTEDVTGNTTTIPIGEPTAPTTLRPTLSRGVQFNRWPIADQQAGNPPPALQGRDALVWGEPKTLELENARAIRAVSFWVYWDAFSSRRATVWESSNEGRKDRVWFGVEGGAPMLAPAPSRIAEAAQEVSAATAQAVGPVTEPFRLTQQPPTSLTHGPEQNQSGMWVFEIWDGEQRIMRLEGPPASAITGQWQHVTLTTAATTTTATTTTATTSDWWPTWQLWVSGRKLTERSEGRQIPAETLTENYIGRGLRGCLMDFRVYDRPMTPSDITATMEWAKEKLHPTP